MKVQINQWIKEGVVYDELAECIRLVKLESEDDKEMKKSIENVHGFVVAAKLSLPPKGQVPQKQADKCIKCGKQAASRCSRCKQGMTTFLF